MGYEDPRGASAVVSHRSAATVWGLLRPEPAAPVDVTVISGHRRSRRGVRVHHAPTTASLQYGIPVTSPLRTLLDMASVRDPHTDPAIAQALAHRLIQPQQLASLDGRRGVTSLRAAAASEPLITRSEAERVMPGVIARAGLPRPHTNVRVAGHEVDAYWPQSRVVVEVDGFAFHSARHAFERDRLRDQQLVAAGYRVLRITWRQLTSTPEGVAVRLAAALSAA